MVSWLRRNVGWSNSRESWQERIGALSVLLGVLLALVYGGRLSVEGRLIVWGLLLLTSVVLLRRGWLKLFGPVLFYDVLRSARRGRFVWVRCAYAGLLLFILFTAYLGSRYTAARMGTAAAEARMAEEFFNMFISTQLLAVVVLTPAYVAGSIAEEKDRKTLEFLLATDLRNREIVLSKLVARMANIILFILTGLPLMSMIQFLGGVDPMLVQAGFAATALTMIGLAGVSILASTWCRRPRAAIATAYLLLVMYLGLSSLLYLAQAASAQARSRPVMVLQAPPGGGPPVARLQSVERVEPKDGFTWGLANHLANGFNAGNLFPYLWELRDAVTKDRPEGQGVGTKDILETKLPGMVGSYAIFHVLLAILCTAWAVFRLRAVALRQMQGKGPEGSAVRRLRPRPPVGNHPMWWKEVFAEGWRFGGARWVVVVVVLVSAFVPTALVLLFHHLNYPYADRPSGDRFLIQLNGWAVRAPGTLVGCLMLLAVAVRASTSFSGERDRQTLDSLLTTPMDSTPMLVGKWLGSILSVRLGMLWLVLLWGIGIATGALSPVALPLVAAAWLVFAAFAATLGMWFSILCGTSLRSTIWTLMTALGVSAGHWLPWLCCLAIPGLQGSAGYI
ncbi:MAG TPA: ABC transporter permease subunit, partial [Gemmataceae bacterium]|nr:ABC transporter permease subunit [Gemmataceae bacterium]